MIVGFLIWTAVSAAILGIGIFAWQSEEAVGFYTGAEPPRVSDARGFNRSVAMLWFAYAALLELLGLPFLFLKQNDAGFLWVALGVVAITIGLMVGFHRIIGKYGTNKT